MTNPKWGDVYNVTSEYPSKGSSLSARGWRGGAQLDERLTLDFSSGCDLRIMASGPKSGSVLNGKPLPLPLMYSLALSNKYIKSF